VETGLAFAPALTFVPIKVSEGMAGHKFGGVIESLKICKHPTKTIYFFLTNKQNDTTILGHLPQHLVLA